MQPALMRDESKPQRPVTRVTFQFVGTLEPAPEETAAALFSRVVPAAVAWLQSSIPWPLPPGALEGRSFDVELQGQSARCAAVPEDGLWAARLMRPDTPHGDQPAVAGRTWFTELSLVQGKSGVRVGIRAHCSSLPFATERVRPGCPRIVRDLARQFQLKEVRQVGGAPWHLEKSEDLAEFHALLTSPRRTLPVYLLTQPSPGRLGIETLEFLLDADALAERTLAAAYVVTLPKDLGFQWTQMVGKPWSAYLGTVRTYNPGLRFEQDSPFDHPMGVAERVLAFRYNELSAEDAFLEMLVEQAHYRAAAKRVDWTGLPFLEDVQIRRAELARESATDDSALVSGLKGQVEALSEKIEGLKSELSVAVDLAGQVEEENLALKDEARRLRVQLDTLRREFLQKTGTSPDALVRAPRSFLEFEEWVRSQLAGRVMLHSRALRGLRDATYEDPSLAANALLLLANEFRSMQLGERGAHEAFDSARQSLNLRFGRSISPERAGEEGETYFVKIGPRGEERRFLDYHLRKGSGKDPRHCLAIYFFWDESREQVVVGWMPSHLENRMT